MGNDCPRSTTRSQIYTYNDREGDIQEINLIVWNWTVIITNSKMRFYICIVSNNFVFQSSNLVLTIDLVICQYYQRHQFQQLAEGKQNSRPQEKCLHLQPVVKWKWKFYSLSWRALNCNTLSIKKYVSVTIESILLDRAIMPRGRQVERLCQTHAFFILFDWSLHL